MVLHQQAKHIEVNMHYIWEIIHGHFINLQYCLNYDKFSDIFTKPFNKRKFLHLWSFLGVRDASSFGGASSSHSESQFSLCFGGSCLSLFLRALSLFGGEFYVHGYLIRLDFPRPISTSTYAFLMGGVSVGFYFLVGYLFFPILLCFPYTFINLS